MNTQRIYKALILLMLITAFSSSAYDALANTFSEPLPKLPADQILFPNSAEFHTDFDKGIAGDCQGLLSRLEQALQNKETEFPAHAVYGELYDRAICVPFDPAKAFDHFERAAEMGAPPYYVIVGWKYTYGHGVEVSPEKARDAFERSLIETAFIPQFTNIYAKIFSDRQVPIALKKGSLWLEERIRSETGKISLARELLEGGGTYYDGSPLMKNPWAAKALLGSLPHNAKANHVLGNALLHGLLGKEKGAAGQVYLAKAATCGVAQAVIDIIDNMKNQRFGYRDIDFIAYAWYLFGLEKGYEGVRVFEETFKTPSYSMRTKTPNYINQLHEQALNGCD